MALALSYPEMVKRLVLVSTPTRVIEESRDALQLRLGKPVNRVMGIGLFGGSTQPYYAFFRQLEASRGYDCTERLGEVGAPILIVNGAKDDLAPPSQRRKCTPGSEAHKQRPSTAAACSSCWTTGASLRRSWSSSSISPPQAELPPSPLRCSGGPGGLTQRERSSARRRQSPPTRTSPRLSISSA